MIAQHRAEAETAGVIDAGMVFTVADHIVVSTHHGADDTQIGLEAGGKGRGGLLMQKIGERILQLQMQLQRSVEKAGAGAARAVLFERFHAGFDDLLVDGQTQIIVGAEHDAALALHDDLRILPRFQRVEVGINTPFPHFDNARFQLTSFK